MKKLFTFLMCCLGLYVQAIAQNGPIITEFSFNSPISNVRDSLEFVEIYNPTTTTFSMRDYILFVDGYYVSLIGDLHDMTLRPNEVMVFSLEGTALINAYNMNIPHRFSGNDPFMPNTQADIVLKDLNDVTIDSVHYDASLLPAGVNGGGYSLVLCDLTADNSNASSSAWTLSTNAILNADGSPRMVEGFALYGSPGFLECGTTIPSYTPNPSNDKCINAQVLQPNPVCQPVAGSVHNALQDFNTNLPNDCRGVFGYQGDVWYKFQATDTAMTIVVDGVGYFDAVIELFSGQCGQFDHLACVQDIYMYPDSPAVQEILEYTNFTIGETYYFRVFDHYSPMAHGSEFGVCVLGPAPVNPCDSINIEGIFTICDRTYYAEPMGNGTAPYTIEWANGTVGDSTIVMDSTVLTGVKITDANGCSNNFEFTPNFPFYPCPSVNEVARGFNMKIYPNPTKGHAVLSLKTLESVETTIQIANINGQILSSEVVFVEGDMAFDLKISDLPSGVYMVMVQSQNVIATQQLIIK